MSGSYFQGLEFRVWGFDVGLRVKRVKAQGERLM